MVPEVTDQAAVTAKLVMAPVGTADTVPMGDRTMVTVMAGHLVATKLKVVTKHKGATEVMAVVSKEVAVPLADTAEEDIRDAAVLEIAFY